MFEAIKRKTECPEVEHLFERYTPEDYIRELRSGGNSPLGIVTSRAGLNVYTSIDEFALRRSVEVVERTLDFHCSVIAILWPELNEEEKFSFIDSLGFGGRRDLCDNLSGVLEAYRGRIRGRILEIDPRAQVDF